MNMGVKKYHRFALFAMNDPRSWQYRLRRLFDLCVFFHTDHIKSQLKLNGSESRAYLSLDGDVFIYSYLDWDYLYRMILCEDGELKEVIWDHALASLNHVGFVELDTEVPSVPILDRSEMECFSQGGRNMFLCPTCSDQEGKLVHNWTGSLCIFD